MKEELRQRMYHLVLYNISPIQIFLQYLKEKYCKWKLFMMKHQFITSIFI
jgi:hypothetical protein